MSEKKTGKRLLSWVLVLIMALSLLPLNVLADEVSETQDVIQGYYDQNGVWTAGTNSPDLPNGVDSVNKTAEPTGTPNEYTVKLEVKMHTTTETQTSYAKAATVLVIDTSSSMSYCLLPEHEHTDSCYISTGVQCNDTHLSIKKVYHHIIGDGICIYDESDETYYKATLGCGLKEHEHSEGCGGDNDRLATAKAAAINFLNSYRAGGTGRYVALVRFSTGATVAAGWQDVSTPDGYTAILKAIDGLSADGGTNLQQGLVNAQNLFNESTVSAIPAKHVVALTDGEPTLYGKNGNKGARNYCNENTFNATNTAATNLKTVARLHTISFGTSTKNMLRKAGDLFTEPEWWRFTVSEYLATYVASSESAYSANNADDLNKVFDAISNTITSGLSSGTVHDSLPDGVTSDAIPNRTVEWNLNTFDKETSTNGPEGNTTTYYTYTKSYTVTIDPTQIPEIQDGDYYPLNGPTTLTVGDGVVINFPIPAGKVTLQKYKLTYIVDGETYDENTYADHANDATNE